MQISRTTKTGHIREQIKHLLSLSDSEQIRCLFREARNVRNQYFGSKVFFYGFLYFSTYCRNDCRFCRYMRSNTSLLRYRKSGDQILEAARQLAGEGVHLIDLTMGEDPEWYASGPDRLREFITMVKNVQHETDLPVMISPGSVPDPVIAAMAREKICWYACYQETHNRSLFEYLRKGQDFEKRAAKKQTAKNHGMLIEEGILTGVGETIDDLADSILWMKDFQVDQARVMTFVPKPGTPMAGAEFQNSLKEQMVIAVMRLVLPDILIPASLDVEGIEGLRARLDAGANVVTSLIPPKLGLDGVANNSSASGEFGRTLEDILPVLKTSKLEPALSGEYKTWIKARQQKKAC